MRDSDETIKPKGRLAPDNLGRSYLLSASYDGDQRKAYMRLYEPETQQMYLWYDNTGHQPYLISKQTPEELKENHRIVNHSGFQGFQEVIRYDGLRNEEIKVTKVVAADPLSIGGGAGAIRNHLESWESRIRYYSCYIYDQGIVPGMPYRVVDGDLVPDDWSIPKEVEAQFAEILGKTEERFRASMMDWARLLQCPIPEIRRVAVDIEVRPSVQNRMPSADQAGDPIICVAFAGSDGLRRVVLLNDSGLDVETLEIEGAAEAKVYDSEREIVYETFRIIEEYPVVLTFNGDDFDFKYLRNRARNLGIPDDDIPITLGRRFVFL